MDNLTIAPSILDKLRNKHGVQRSEVEECFANIEYGVLEDTREEHKTDPLTQWFIAETNKGRRLYVAFVFEAGEVRLKTAFEPTADRERVYRKFTRREG